MTFHFQQCKTEGSQLGLTSHNSTSCSREDGRTLRVMTYILFDAPLHKEQENIWFRIVTVFEIFFLTFPVSEAIITCRTVITYIPYDAPLHKKQKYIWFRGGNLNLFWDCWTFPVSEGIRTCRMFMTYIPFNAPLDKEQKYIWIRGWNLNHFLSNLNIFLFQGEIRTPRTVMTYILFVAQLHKEQ